MSNYKIENQNIFEGNSCDVIEKLTELFIYLKFGDDIHKLFKPSKTELINEIKFKQRAEKILDYLHRHDQMVIEEKIINELQEGIDDLLGDMVMNNDFHIEKFKPTYIAGIYDKLMVLKMLCIKDSKNMNSLKDFIKFNESSLRSITQIEREIKSQLEKLSPNKKALKKSEIKITLNTSKDYRSSMSQSNVYRRNDLDANNQLYTKTQQDHVKRMKRQESDYSRPLEIIKNQSCIDQITRNKYNEDMLSHDLMMNNDVMMNSFNDDLVEFSSLNSTLFEENENSNNGDIQLILQPFN